MIAVFTSFITAFIITYFAVPSVLRVASIHKLFDIPDERKVHKETIPALGGIAIFAGVFFSILFWTDSVSFESLRWTVLSLVIIFFLGLQDDVVSIKPTKKLIGEIIASGIIVINGNVRVHNLQGLLGIYELPYLLSILLTLFAFIVLINAFNLIDGIDGLAGGIGTIASISFGSFFLNSDQPELAVIAFTLAGALLAFLKYNFQPAKIFMGDGGSLLVGFLLAILCVKFIDLPVLIDKKHNVYLHTPPVAMSILIIPLADTLRVFILRVLKGKSPFQADRNHFHHVLLNLGLNHQRAAIILYSVNIFFIWAALSLNKYGINILFMMVVLNAYILNLVLYMIKQRKKENTWANLLSTIIRR